MVTGGHPRPPALDAYIKLVRAASSVTALLEPRLRAAGLTTSQFGVLEAVHHLGPLCLGDLARKILTSSANLTTVVDSLERRRLVARRRDPSDRRRIEVCLTTRGRRLISGLFPSHARAIEHAFSTLDEAEQRELAGLCRRLGLAAAAAKP
jgi:MarR family 2-MHQ and catechol resistance regulon transcriptional repressor